MSNLHNGFDADGNPWGVFFSETETSPADAWQEIERNKFDELRLAYSYSVYALLEPDTKEVRYVGLAADVFHRAQVHASNQKPARTPISRWLRRLRSRGQVPHLVELCEIHNNKFDGWSAPQALEAYYIAEMAKFAGLRLLNRQNNPLWVRTKRYTWVPRKRNTKGIHRTYGQSWFAHR